VLAPLSIILGIEVYGYPIRNYQRSVGPLRRKLLVGGDEDLNVDALAQRGDLGYQVSTWK
jgi:hypothetical protein